MATTCSPISTAIVTYLDALNGNPPLLPADAKARGKAIWWEEFADTILAPAGGKIVFNRFVGPKLLGIPGDEAAAELGEKEFAPIVAYLEGAVPAAGWLTGPEFSIGDIAVASVLKTMSYVGNGPDADRHPATAAWYARVTSRQSWIAVSDRERGVFEAGRASA
ncbi:glutathione S-transferase family protein [Novosphingobium sp. Gsoil 351]|uniref:glutathione S-transferase family protein n=1 Tax=Novosphingobium sp. Gsoil 351 TaxID=2675225 RepID=UPI0012B4963F|nr:glutathione S-transferase family protein [Novosphingobium sp. Gsoil 351]QGN53280.1 glutathione S-transferase family protein [Novosphingobium sp. Gsoil 351]